MTTNKTLYAALEHMSHAEVLAGARRGHKLSNSVSRTPMTLTRLSQLVLQGFGQGRNDDYTPWIRVTRGNAPRQSNHIVEPNPVHERSLNLLSRLEHRAAQRAAWLGVLEIREQFPIFPWRDGPHPMTGLCAQRDAALPSIPGLMEIARKAHISIGSYVGTEGLPYVATVDLVLRVGDPPNDRLVFWSCKPRGILDDPKRGRRAKERIDLERRFAEHIGAEHRVYDDTFDDRWLDQNLEWLAPRFRERHSGSEQSDRFRFADAFVATGHGDPLGARIRSAAAAIGVVDDRGHKLFRAAAWLGLIDIDLRHPIIMARPVRRETDQFKLRQRAQLLGSPA